MGLEKAQSVLEPTENKYFCFLVQYRRYGAGDIEKTQSVLYPHRKKYFFKWRFAPQEVVGSLPQSRDKKPFFFTWIYIGITKFSVVKKNLNNCLNVPQELAKK